VFHCILDWRFLKVHLDKPCFCNPYIKSFTGLEHLLRYENDILITALPKAVANDPLEKNYLKMLKCILGVHRKANNNFCYDDTGRTPWAIDVIPQCISYFAILHLKQPQEV
jgi:hypothetical protein